jgi:uncharacterized repeat protein (TIGR03803 family)
MQAQQHFQQATYSLKVRASTATQAVDRPSTASERCSSSISSKGAVLYTFTGGTDGANPFGDLAHDATGNLYGATLYGGRFDCDQGQGCGIVFKLDAAGNETVLYSFTDGADGGFPGSGVVADAAGNLYGTTEAGGDFSCGGGFGCGTVFRIDGSGNFTALYSFAGGSDGISPTGVLNRDSAGNFYGTFQGGGSGCNGGFGCGTVFRLDSDGKETVLYSFAGGAVGMQPDAGVVRDSAGNLYGTTPVGGDLACGGGFGCGTVFRLDSSGKKTVLHKFSGMDGAYPDAGLTRDAAGNLYGTTNNGGAHNKGTVYKITP